MYGVKKPFSKISKNLVFLNIAFKASKHSLTLYVVYVGINIVQQGNKI